MHYRYVLFALALASADAAVIVNSQARSVQCGHGEAETTEALGPLTLGCVGSKSYAFMVSELSEGGLSAGPFTAGVQEPVLGLFSEAIYRVEFTLTETQWFTVNARVDHEFASVRFSLSKDSNLIINLFHDRDSFRGDILLLAGEYTLEGVATARTFEIDETIYGGGGDIVFAVIPGAIAIPEPATALLLLPALCVMLRFRRTL